jgi:hypothetical protein
MFEGLLPIGTVVLLKNSQKRVMIIGVLQKQMKNDEAIIWDYSGCFYPEGYMGPDKTFLFNSAQIDKVFAVGYQDQEQFAFKEKIDQVRKEILTQDNKNQ